MQPTRRTLLKTSATAVAVGFAGCQGGGDDSTTEPSTTTSSPEETPMEDGSSDGEETEEVTPTADVTAETAVAARWNVLRARLWDAAALGQAGMTDAGARAAGSLFEDFEGMNGEYGAHEMLEATDTDAYGTFEGGLSDLRESLSNGDVDAAGGAAAEADGALRDVQASLTTGRVAQALTLQTLGARAATADVLASADATAAAADVAREVRNAFDESPVYDTVEEADGDAYEAFETALSDIETAANNGDAEGVRTAAHETLGAAIDGSYAVIDPDDIAGVGHLAAMGARGHDAAVLNSLGGPSTDYAHAAGLTIYRARAYDTHWLAARGNTDTAVTMASDVFAHFEGARAHEALEEADAEAYEGFEGGLDSLSTALGNGNSDGIDSAVASVDSNLVTGIEALTTAEQGPILQAAFFRARLGDARVLYDLDQTSPASTIAKSVFERFEQNELDFHETLEETDESLYEEFENTHLVPLIDALENGNDSAVETHYQGAQQALLDFEAQHSVTLASPAEAGYMAGRVFDAAALAALDKPSTAASIVGDAFEHFENGAAGFHEALEEASEETYETFESRLGAVRTAANNNDDVYTAAKTFNESGVTAAYDTVAAAGGTYANAAGDIVSDIFATFENAAVHEQLEDGNEAAYESFEASLNDYQSALSEGGDVSTAAATFDRATTRALFAAVSAVEDAPVVEGSEESDEPELSGGPNVVEGVPDDTDHVVDMQAVAFEPAELTVSAGDEVAFSHAGGEAHNVVAYDGQIPEGATYWSSGGFESEQAARDGWEAGEGAVQSGQSYVHTFETTGTHEYFCVPHEAAGMQGTIIVE